MSNLSQEKSSTVPKVPVNESERTCRSCHQMFLPSKNASDSCVYHPEFYTGETAQRWMVL